MFRNRSLRVNEDGFNCEMRIAECGFNLESGICNLEYFCALVRARASVFLFQRNSTFDKFDDQTEKLKDETTDFIRIRCPQCRWQPQASSRWYCTDAGHPHYFYNGCGAVWNTFETRGRCPGCHHQWKWTDCLRCHASSPHEAWYETEPD